MTIEALRNYLIAQITIVKSGVHTDFKNGKWAAYDEILRMIED